jgi:hypothetical protein
MHEKGNDMYKFVVEKPDRKIIMGDSEDNIKIDK